MKAFFQWGRMRRKCPPFRGMYILTDSPHIILSEIKGHEPYPARILSRSNAPLNMTTMYIIFRWEIILEIWEILSI